jgi:hypothetical protein
VYFAPHRHRIERDVLDDLGEEHQVEVVLRNGLQRGYPFEVVVAMERDAEFGSGRHDARQREGIGQIQRCHEHALLCVDRRLVQPVRADVQHLRSRHQRPRPFDLLAGPHEPGPVMA